MAMAIRGSPSNSFTQSAMIRRVPIWYLGTHKLETFLSFEKSSLLELKQSIAKAPIFLLLSLHFKVSCLLNLSLQPSLNPSNSMFKSQEQQVKIHPEEHFPSRNVWTMTTLPGSKPNGHLVFGRDTARVWG